MSTRPKHHFALVEVTWEDASHLPMGWENSVPDYRPHTIKSLGYLIVSDRKRVVLAMDVDTEDGEHNQRAQIPAGMVRRIKVLRKADK